MIIRIRISMFLTDLPHYADYRTLKSFHKCWSHNNCRVFIHSQFVPMAVLYLIYVPCHAVKSQQSTKDKKNQHKSIREKKARDYCFGSESSTAVSLYWRRLAHSNQKEGIQKVPIISSVWWRNIFSGKLSNLAKNLTSL